MSKETPNKDNKFDAMLDSVKETGIKGVEKVKSLNQKTMDAISDPHLKDNIKEKIGDAKDNIKEKIGDAYEKTKEVDL